MNQTNVQASAKLQRRCSLPALLPSLHLHLIGCRHNQDVTTLVGAKISQDGAAAAANAWSHSGWALAVHSKASSLAHAEATTFWATEFCCFILAHDAANLLPALHQRITAVRAATALAATVPTPKAVLEEGNILSLACGHDHWHTWHTAQAEHIAQAKATLLWRELRVVDDA